MNTYILQIDTATAVCSVSISNNGVVLECIDAQEPNMHASMLTVFIEQLLERVSLSYQDLSAIAVSKGPGSYTGLRIGVSTAKGLCYALDIPLISVNTLQSMFWGYKKDNRNTKGVFIPMLDARRMEVYLMAFNEQGEVLRPTQAVIMDEHSFEHYGGQNIVLFGSGAAKLKDLFKDQPEIRIDEDFEHSSSSLSFAAYRNFVNQHFEDLIYFEPYYLKEFIATTPKAKL